MVPQLLLSWLGTWVCAWVWIPHVGKKEEDWIPHLGKKEEKEDISTLTHSLLNLIFHELSSISLFFLHFFSSGHIFPFYFIIECIVFFFPKCMPEFYLPFFFLQNAIALSFLIECIQCILFQMHVSEICYPWFIP